MSYLNNIRQQLSEMRTETEEWVEAMNQMEIERQERKFRTEKSILKKLKTFISDFLIMVTSRIKN